LKTPFVCNTHFIFIKNSKFFKRVKITNQFNPIIWIVSLLISIILFFTVFYNCKIGSPQFIAMTSMIVILCITMVFLFSMKIEIVLSENEVKYKVFPFDLSYKTINKEEIKTISIREVNAFREFGGVGVRYRGLYTAYLIRGEYALDLQFCHKKILLDIGYESDIEELKTFLEKHYTSN
jgi:hypothetical protein